MSKYNAKKVIVTADGTLFEEALIKKYKLDITGIRFDSKKEGEYYQELQRLLKIGVVIKIEIHPVFILQDKPLIKYIADFHVTYADGQKEIIDIKGFETPLFRLKFKLFESKYPDLKLLLLTKKRGQWLSLDIVKKEKSDHKRAENRLLKLASKQEGHRNARRNEN